MRVNCCLPLAAAIVLLSACAGGAPQPDPVGPGGLPEVSALEELSRAARVIEFATVDGADALASSGDPSAVVQGTQLVLDGDAAPDSFAWGVWRVQLAAGQSPVSLALSFNSIGLRRYWAAYANFTTGRWEFLSTGATEFGTQGALASFAPADPGALLSPTRAMYVAVLSRPGQQPSSVINVSQVEATYDTEPPPDPIFDDFEDNDQLEDCFPIGAGSWKASIHETGRGDMNDPNEVYDKYDFYCINVPAGKQLTVTLRHEAQNHFLENPPPSDYTDLDLLFYPDSATQELDDFIEASSSFQIFPGGFEQIYLTGLSGPYKLGVFPDPADGYQDNAEYELSVFYSDQTYSVSGKVTQDGQTPMTDFTAFLEPGNFNDDTWMEPDEEPGSRGDFMIRGVPPGNYTLRVQGGARHSQSGWLYEATLPVTITNSNVTSANIDIEPYSGP